VKRPFLFLLIISLFLPQNFANAADKVGGACKKKGQVTTIKNTKVLCVMQGKKLIWKTSNQILSGQNKPIANGLTPEFAETYSSSTSSVSINIPNYSSDYSWQSAVSTGKSTIDGNGQVEIYAFKSNSPLILTVTTTRSGYMSSTKTLNFSPKFQAQMPSIVQSLVKSIDNGCEFEVYNLDAMMNIEVEADSGEVKEVSRGKYLISGLQKNTSTRVKIFNTDPDYLNSSFAFLNCETKPIFEVLNQRDWKLIAKDPEGNKGRYIKIFGKITQFDAATGTSRFRADIAGTVDEVSATYFYGDNTFLSGDATTLKNYIVGDKFQADVKVESPYTYTTTLNGQVTVPFLTLVSIARLG